MKSRTRLSSHDVIVDKPMNDERDEVHADVSFIIGGTALVCMISIGTIIYFFFM